MNDGALLIYIAPRGVGRDHVNPNRRNAAQVFLNANVWD